MNRRTLLLMFVLWLGAGASLVFAEAKAYELVKYQGKAGGVTIAFDFADGYPEASELKVTEANSRKPVLFLLDGLGPNHFAPVKSAGAIKSVTLTLDMEDRAPAKVEGSYEAGGKTVSFTLSKKK
ncbi:MAG TPA: hypothetical protein VK961_11620 [Chthoniobacter sp.]|nr:hypothetical protein [Chthoniobacter sp.]